MVPPRLCQPFCQKPFAAGAVATLARVSWCHAGFARGMGGERSPRPHHGTSKLRGSFNHAPDAPSHFLLDSRLVPCARISKTECKNRGWASPKHNSKLFPGKVTGAAENSSKSRGKGMSTGGTSLKVPVGSTPGRFPASPSVLQVPAVGPVVSKHPHPLPATPSFALPSQFWDGN